VNTENLMLVEIMQERYLPIVFSSSGSFERGGGGLCATR
jgi:hypothetical protein